MKHLLIILSILLLFSPLYGDNHKGEILFRWGDVLNYKWKGFGDKETHPIYQGDVENGKPNGLGILIHPWGTKYVGEWKNGKEHGQGKMTFVDGSSYDGGYFDGMRHGRGIETFGNFAKYVGEYVHGYKDGKGTLTFSDGRKFVGEWKFGGEMWNGKWYDKNGKIESKIVNGKKIEQ